MKLHEACYWLNVIITEKRREARRYAESLTAKEKSDAVAHATMEETTAELEALEIAASALTK